MQSIIRRDKGQDGTGLTMEVSKDEAIIKPFFKMFNIQIPHLQLLINR